MKDLFKQIEIFIKEELSLINPKISGIVLLEILKYKIIDKLRNLNLNIYNEIKENVEFNNSIENESNKIGVMLKFFKNPVSNLNFENKKNKLFICIKETIKLNIKDYKTKKIFNYNCIPMTGIVMSNGTNCKVKFEKNSLILELEIEDKIINIEKKE